MNCSLLMYLLIFLQVRVATGRWNEVVMDWLAGARERTRGRILLESPFGWQWYFAERVLPQSLGEPQAVPGNLHYALPRTTRYTLQELQTFCDLDLDLESHLDRDSDYTEWVRTHLAGGLRTDERIEGRIGDSSEEEDAGVVGEDEDDGDRFDESEGEGEDSVGGSVGDADSSSEDSGDSDGDDSLRAPVRGGRGRGRGRGVGRGRGGGRGQGIPLKEITYQRPGGEVRKVTMCAPVMPYTVPPGRVSS